MFIFFRIVQCQWFFLLVPLVAIITESAPRPIPSSSCDILECVCVPVSSLLIIDYAPMFEVLVVYHEIDSMSNFWYIINIKEHKNCMIGSKVATFLERIITSI